MKTSQAGIDLIKTYEGCNLKEYLCPAGKRTIGFGHTGKDVTEGLVITMAKAEELLRSDLATVEWQVGKAVTKPLTQNQFDAVVSFVYNVGVTNFKKSTMLRLMLVDPHNPKIASEFARWKFAAGRVLAGLVARRQAESSLYFTK